MLSIAQAAEQLGVSEKTIRRAIERGDLVAYQPARRILIRPADLDAYLESKRVQPRRELPLEPVRRIARATGGRGLRELVRHAP
jgi:excisionase family DNA binding protein